MSPYALPYEMLLFAAILAASFYVARLAIVFIYCWWLVRFTGKAESLREVAPVLRELDRSGVRRPVRRQRREDDP